MNEASNNDYSTLRDALLRMYLPVKGVHTFADMLTCKKRTLSAL